VILVKGLVALVLLFIGVFVIIFLAGLGSAALEIRRERKAGLVPTRPAWDNRRKRRANGGLWETIRVLWATHSTKLDLCWCGQGPMVYFPALTQGEAAGLGCSAWESGDPEAIRRHDAAGGYSRTPTDEVPASFTPCDHTWPVPAFDGDRCLDCGALHTAGAGSTS
jgi:hypothetical protein